MTGAPADGLSAVAGASRRETALQQLVTAFISTGLIFLLLPGTFLGVWNLIAISSHRAAHSLSPAWIQAHGQAQMFGWIGSFIIGIGFYSLSKMGRLRPFAIARGWQSWSFWTSGIALHWLAGVCPWRWRLLLPAGAVLMLAGFLLFFSTIHQHRPPRSTAPLVQLTPIWMRLILCSTFAFLVCLLLNAAGTLAIAVYGVTPALPAALDGRLLLLSAWGFLVITVWGFNARWLPVFAGFAEPNSQRLQHALYVLIAALIAGLAGVPALSGLLLLGATILAAVALHVFEPGVQRAKTQNIHWTFPHFLRFAYGWLIVAAALAIPAALLDHNGGFTGASRHALTVGFLGTMVFSIGCRILPAFCGMRLLFSSRLMFYALALLSIGCLLRVFCEIPAYEFNSALAWSVLPASAILELTAVALFALNLFVTFARPPAHLQSRTA